MAITLTENAATRVRTFLASRGSGVGLRLGIKKTGCSGFAYVVNYADEVGAEDVVFEHAGVKVVDQVNMFSHLANIGDTRSLIIHPASTTHRQLSEEQQVGAGAGPDVVRLSVGIETVEDIIADLDQAFATL